MNRSRLSLAKCVSRKCRCTYVKFHRQTAPIGPGHQAPRSSASTSPIIGNRPSHLDDLFLAPPPATVPSMTTSYSDPIMSSQFPFHPAYSSADLPPISAGDIKYRPEADRVGLPTSTAPNGFPGLYTNPSQQPAQSWYPWGEASSAASASLFDSNRYLPPLDDKDYHSGVTRTQLHSDAFDPDFYDPNDIVSPYRSRRPSFDFSDSSSASQSVPSSATSSNVHLPLSGTGDSFDTASDDMHRQHSASSSSYHVSEPHRVAPEGGFSNAFGLMSIEDQNAALAHLPQDSLPFFSNMGGIAPHSPNATPMPARPSSHSQQAAYYRDRGMSLPVLQTPGAELRDVWKACVRTPLGVPGSIGLDGHTPNANANANGSSSHQLHMPTSPSAQRRRVRVSSLPSVTPTTERACPHGSGVGQADAHASRAILHGNFDDLQSYQAAVNARSPYMHLNLVPRRRGTRPSPVTNGSPAPSSSAGSADMSGVPGTLGSGEAGAGASRPSSSQSTSSLAHAFGPLPQAQPQAHVQAQGLVKPPPLSGASISLPIPSIHGHARRHATTSRESSVGSSDGTGGGSSEGEAAFRPSFKRLASQTLGPASSKRAFVERRGVGVSGDATVSAEENSGVPVAS